MKYTKPLTVLIAGIIISIIVASGINYALVSQPEKVRFSIHIPQEFNSTAFSWTTNLHYNLDKENQKVSFPYIITGVETPGTKFTLKATFFGGNITQAVNGTNIIQNIPQDKILGTDTFNIEVKELNDNVVPFSYDIWSTLLIAALVIVIMFITVLGVLCSLPYEDEVTSSTEKGEQ